MDMLRHLDEAPGAGGAQATRELIKLKAQLQAEIRAREAAEAQLRQMQKMETIGQLAGGIAHDFANMLTVIMGNLEIARRRLAQGRADVTELLDKAISGGDRAAALAHRLLALSRRQAHSPVVVNVNALVSGLAELLRGTLGENIELECVCADGLWSTCVDPCQLENAIMNLAVNARDAMPGGGCLTIETRNVGFGETCPDVPPDVSATECVVITVTDTGTGMAPEVAAHAFDPFFTTKESRGTGLGLSQVHDFVTQSGGHLQARSEVGRGTSLRIYLPRHMDGGAVSNM